MSELHICTSVCDGSVAWEEGGWLKTRKWHHPGMSDTKNMLHKIHKQTATTTKKKLRAKEKIRVLMWIGERYKISEILVHFWKADDRDEIYERKSHEKENSFRIFCYNNSHMHTHLLHILWQNMILYEIFFFISLLCTFLPYLVGRIYSHQRKLNPLWGKSWQEEKKLMLFYFLYFVFRLSPNRFKCQLKSKCGKAKKKMLGGVWET